MIHKRKGIMFILSSPSGGGKTTIRKALLKKEKSLHYVVSETSRPKRPGEVHGRDYVFVSIEAFLKKIKKSEYYEYAKVHENYYGTPRKLAEKHLKAGRDCLLDIDVQGFKKIRKAYPLCVSIFILPPSMKILANRLKGRKTENSQAIKKRLINAQKEIKYSFCYDYPVVNRTVAETVKKVKAIVLAERIKKNVKGDLYGYLST